MAKHDEIARLTKGGNGQEAPPPSVLRDEKGRFRQGTKPGPGNPHAVAVAAWRSALVSAVTADDVEKVVGVLMAKAKAGEAWAVKELLDRCLGKAQQKMELEATGETGWAAMVACLQAVEVSGEGGKK